MRRLEAHDALRYEDILRIADQAKNDRDKALIYVLWLTGARISEALRLTLDDVRIDIDEDGRKVLVFEIFTLKRKDHPTRAIPVYLDHPQDGQLAKWLIHYFKGLAQKELNGSSQISEALINRSTGNMLGEFLSSWMKDYIATF